MVFSSLTFLYAYLPIVLAVYFLVPMRWRNFVLLVVSLFFYGWGEPVYVLIMIASIIINWLFGKTIAKYRKSDRKKAKTALILCMVFNLALLGFFKLLGTADALEAPLVEVEVDDRLRRNAVVLQFLDDGKKQAGLPASTNAGNNLDQVRPVERAELSQIGLTMEDALLHGAEIYRTREKMSS